MAENREDKLIEMLDREHIDYCLREIKKRKTVPYGLACDEVADGLFPAVKAIYPNAKMYRYDICQWITVSPAAEKKLKKMFEEMIKKREQEIQELERMLLEF